MSEQKKYIGFDIGAESGRCVVGFLLEKRIELTEVHRFSTPFIETGGHFYWDILAMYQELLQGLSQAKEKFGSHFEGISVDTWGVDYVLLDADGRLLGYPYHYRDNRTDGILEKAYKVVPKKDIYDKTGIQFIQFNTLFQLFAERFQKLNLTKVADKVLMIPDYLLYLLSGKKIGEYSIISTSNLADPFKRNWCWKLAESFDLPAKIFPEVVEPGTKLGELLPEIAEKTGIEKNTPVIASASHDTGAAVASVPADQENWAYLSSGTWSLMGIEIPEPLMSDLTLEYNFTNEGGVGKTIRFLKNIIGLWPVQECRRFWAENGKEFDYSELAKMADENGPANAWINVDDPRFVKLGEMPQKIISFLQETDQKYQENECWVIRCVLESLAFKYRRTIQEVEKVTGNKIERLHAVGGGIQNEVLNQLTADALGIEVIAGPVEGTIVGNIGMQAIATGDISEVKELRKIVVNSFELKIFYPKNSDYFNQNEKFYKTLI